MQAGDRCYVQTNTAHELDSFPENSKVRYSGQLGKKRTPPFSSFKIGGGVNTADESFICLTLADSVSIHNPLDLYCLIVKRTVE